MYQPTSNHEPSLSHSLPVTPGTTAHTDTLARSAQANQPGARESLLHQLYPMLAAAVHKYPKVFPSREDALQEGRLIILEALYSYNPHLGVPFTAYVRQKLHYHFINVSRIHQPLAILDAPSGASSTGGDDALDTWLSTLPDDGPTPEEQLINDELSRWLGDAIMELSEDHQKLFVEHYGLRKTLRQLAEETGLHPVTLSRHKAAMLTNLRQQMKQ